MARERQVGSMRVGLYHRCAVLMREKNVEKKCTEDKWYEDLTVEIKDTWAYIYFADESCRKVLRATNKSTQVYPGMTIYDALIERRSNHISREGLRPETKAAIQADYDAHPLIGQPMGKIISPNFDSAA